MKRFWSNISLSIALWINKAVVIFAKKTRNSLIFTPPLYKIIISIIDGAILCETSSNADIEYGSYRISSFTTFMDRMEARAI